MYDNFFNKITTINYIIYARLSKEEQGKSKEDQSRSIKNQIIMCKNYIEEEKNIYVDCLFTEVAILKDDGISGTTFDREDFQKLVSLIEQKKANMVITKDLSRLGRDHIQTDDYIEKWFPEHNVRYVSIMENIDTYVDSVSNEIAPIINWSNENFARQTSKKIKKTFKNYREVGKWTGGEPPLGYKIDPQNKYHLVIEPKGKEVVERIFKLALENNSLDKIAKILTNDKVPIPSVIKKSKRKSLSEHWSSQSIKNILKNEIYTGNMVQGKTTRLNHKSKKIIYLPKQQWNIIQNTHEAIVDKQTFDSVQLIFKSNKNKTIKSYDYLLKGLIKCHECNHAIGIQHYKNRSKNYTICSFYRKYGNKMNVCTAHRFSYEEIEKLVLKSIKKNCLKFVDKNALIQKLNKRDYASNQVFKLKEKVEKGLKEIAKLNNQLDNIYEDKLNDIISIEQFKNFIKIKKNEIEYEESQLKRYNDELKKIIEASKENFDVNKIVDDFINFSKPNKLLIVKLIDKIFLNQNGTIDIYYKIKPPHY